MKLQILIAFVLCWDLTSSEIPLDFDEDSLDFGMLADNTATFDREREGPSHRRCCLPMKLEGRLKELVGVGAPSPSLVGIGAYFAYDFHRKQAAIVERVWTSHNTSTAFKLIANYDKKSLYIIFHERGAKNLTCITHKLQGSLQQCLPSDASYGRTEILGGSPHGLQTKTYRLRAKSEYVNARVGLTVSQPRGQCVPVAQVGVGVFNGTSPFTISAKYVNLRAQVSFPRIFNPPKGCGPATEEADVTQLTPLMQFFLLKFEAD